MQSEIAIEFKNVTKKFGEKHVLNGIDFQVPRGAICFILGTSGTGKSVLLKNLVGLLKPDNGQIFIEGQQVDQLTEWQFLEIRKYCAMVFQQPALFDSLSVFDNIAFGLRRLTQLTESEIATRVKESLTYVHLESIEQQMPAKISYGMQKRVSIARSIALRPRILLFDEPTTGLDPVTTTAINRLIQELSQKLKTTSLIVSHDMRCALEIANQAIMLDKGRVVAAGPIDQFKQSTNELVRQFFLEVMERRNA